MIGLCPFEKDPDYKLFGACKLSSTFGYDYDYFTFHYCLCAIISLQLM